MIKPALQDDAFLADVERASADEESLHVWWLGQSGFLVISHGRRVVFDPYLSDSLTAKYANTDKPHVRMTQRVVAPHRIDHVEVITSSHNHTDHLDMETLRPLMIANPAAPLVTPAANVTSAAQRLECHPSHLAGVDDGETIASDDEVMITGIAAAHPTLDRDEAGRCRYLGYVVRIGPWTVYHSGDTLVYDGMIERLRPHKVDVAILPINGKLGNMTGVDAARLAKAIDARLVVPCHFDMFAFNTASPDAFARECQRLGQGFSLLKNGQRLTVPAET